MRIFFIIFAFITAFSLYPKVAPLFLSSNSSVSTTNPLASIQKNKRTDTETTKNTNIIADKQNNTKENTTSANTDRNYSKNKRHLAKIQKYKDGEYTGRLADAYYGYVQIKLIINKGKVSDVKFLRFPNSNGNSEYLSSIALPHLKKEVIKVQSGNVDTISGATYTSLAFMKSAKSALTKALN